MMKAEVEDGERCNTSVFKSKDARRECVFYYIMGANTVIKNVFERRANMR